MRGERRAQPPEQGAPEDDRLRAAALTVALFCAVVLFIVGGVVIYALVGEESGPPKAAIVDQLSLTAPNPAFAEEATEMLEGTGYAVDYYPGEQVTVDFYRHLPEPGYELIILRAHVGRQHIDGKPTDEVSLYTSEPYSPTRYVQEQRDGRLKIAVTNPEEPEASPAYFSIPAEFVTSSMRGKFAGATVILMGCDVLTSESMAEAFVQKGASTVVGWDDLVSASHTDAATLNLLQHFLIEDLPIPEAVAAAMAEVGPDPFYDSVLLPYPPGR